MESTYRDHFNEICKIPHISGNTGKLRDYIATFAKEQGLEYKTDNAGNIVVFKSAQIAPIAKPSVILQSHLDMVAASIDGRDMNTRPLDLYIDDGYYMADGTTLGADDGIGVSFMLSILADKKIKHPRLVCIFTNDEEVGMKGANALDPSFLASKYLINLDSEQEGSVVISSAGTVRIDVDVDLKQSKKELEGTVFELSISGVHSGHSAIDTDRLSESVSKLIIDFIAEASGKFPLKLINVSSGYAANAIAGEGNVKLLLAKTANFDKFKEFVMSKIDQITTLYKKTDNDIVLTPKFIRGRFANDGSIAEYIKRECVDIDLAKLFTAFSNIPQTILEKRDGKVLVSNNIGIINFDYNESVLHINLLLRSNDPIRQTYFRDKIVNPLKSVKVQGVNIQVKVISETTPWPIKYSSFLLDVARKAYLMKTGKHLTTRSTHGGLECSIFLSKNKDLDIISIGPNIYYPHSTDESVEIASCDRTYEYLVSILSSL